MFLYSLFCLAGQSIGLGFTWSRNVSTHTFSQLYNYSDDGIDGTLRERLNNLKFRAPTPL